MKFEGKNIESITELSRVGHKSHPNCVERNKCKYIVIKWARMEKEKKRKNDNEVTLSHLQTPFWLEFGL